MKRIYPFTKFIALFLAAFVVGSCENQLEENDVTGAGGSNIFTEEDEYNLADFSASVVPSSDTWVIIDSEAEYDDFEGLRSALEVADADGRQISLIFSNIIEIPGHDSGYSGDGVL
ncbi:MAG: hypothetical protein SNG59_01015 [Rikenellaceae bacterium]